MGASGSNLTISWPMRKTSPKLTRMGLVAAELLVDAVQRALVLDRDLPAARRERGVLRREIAVAREDAARVAPDEGDADRQVVGAGLGAVGAESREDRRYLSVRTRGLGGGSGGDGRRRRLAQPEAARGAELVVLRVRLGALRADARLDPRLRRCARRLNGGRTCAADWSCDGLRRGRRDRR
jgi:hypothetical protein